jgi:hypothetical protein
LRDHPLHHTNLFLGLLESGYETEELQLELREDELEMSVFRSSISDFHCANLRCLELALSIPEYDYDEELAFANCPIRRGDVFGFATFMARANNLEHLLLHRAPVFTLGHPWTGKVEPDTSQLRRDVFHCIATKSYLDGTLIALKTGGILLPKLKSIDFQFHQISLRQLMNFCSEQKHTLERVRLSNVVDTTETLEDEDVAREIQAAIGASLKTSSHVEASQNCYSGRGRMDLLWM